MDAQLVGLGVVFLEAIGIMVTKRKYAPYLTLATIATVLVLFISTAA